MTNGKIKFANEVIREIEPALPIVTTESTEERFAIIRKRTFIDPKTVMEIKRRVQELENVLNELENSVNEFKKSFKTTKQITRVIKIKEKSYKECKIKINELIHERKNGITTLEIAEMLNIEPEIVLKILMELKGEGKIDKINKRY